MHPAEPMCLKKTNTTFSIAILGIRVQTSRWRSFQFLLSRLGACVGATVFAQNPKHDHCSYSHQTILTYYLQCTSNWPHILPPNPLQLPVLRSPHLPLTRSPNSPTKSVSSSPPLRPPSVAIAWRTPPSAPPFPARQQVYPAARARRRAVAVRDGGGNRAAGVVGAGERWFIRDSARWMRVGQRLPFLGSDGAADWLEGEDEDESPPVRGMAYGVWVHGTAAAKASGLL